MNRLRHLSPDTRFLLGGYALVFLIGIVLHPADRLPYALGVMAMSLLIAVDYARHEP